MRRFVQQRHQRLIRNSVFGVGNGFASDASSGQHVSLARLQAGESARAALQKHPRAVPIPGIAANREQTSLDASSHPFCSPHPFMGVARRYCAPSQTTARCHTALPAFVTVSVPSSIYMASQADVDSAECQLVEKREDKRSRKPLVSNPTACALLRRKLLRSIRAGRTRHNWEGMHATKVMHHHDSQRGWTGGLCCIRAGSDHFACQVRSFLERCPWRCSGCRSPDHVGRPFDRSYPRH